MSPTIGDGHVEVDLVPGAWTARWPGPDITSGPFGALVRFSEPRAADKWGHWDVTTTGAGGASCARWLPDGDGVTIELELGAAPGVVVVTATGRATRPDVVRGIEPLRGGRLGLAADRRLVNGYDSWSYAGIVKQRRGDSWWNATLVAPDGRALAFQALTARRFCTRVHVPDPTSVVVACEGAPDAQALDGTWGFATAPRETMLAVRAGDEVTSEPVALAAGSDPLVLTERLAALAGARAGARHFDGPPVAGWESWYHYGLFVGPDDILANARLLRDRYAHVPGFDLVQIDDGWQVTYGAWRPNDRFPADLGQLTTALHALGCRAGLWLAPFMVQPDAPGLATEHPEWMVRDAAGNPVRDRHGRFAADASNPAVRAWLRDLGAQVRAWDVEMVKLDFLYLGAVEGARFDPAVTGTEALGLGLRAFLEGLGDEVYVLGCGMPLLPAVGICHGNRVGHDLAMPVRLRDFGQPLAAGWSGFAGVRAQARNVAARWALHHRWFDADPDVVMAWGSDGALADGYTIEESRTLATLAALCGGPFLLADDLARLRDEERAVLERSDLLCLAGGNGFRPLDLFEHVDEPAPEHVFTQPTDLASTWVADRDGRRVVALFNWRDEPVTRVRPDGFANAPELWTGARADPGPVHVPGHGVRVFVREP